ncbi:MAG TPA: 3-oxoacyl-[acyl-carrier-protein] reductase [Acidimicrobiaceae bacterium]|nr:3-oxoacyl-[acyl-carrier-protein] reductase [Acidimicrobiaceae bacterium]|tara:strand:- start:267 stop:1046 length:780 start_codon:yes stop_codon:yes gene_type:complete
MVNDPLILEAGRVRDGTRALVTGGGSGIGRSIAAALQSAGASVVVCDADSSTNPDFVVDVVEEAAVQQMFASIKQDLGGLDVLVNNVGIAGPAGLVDEIPSDAFDQVLEVNVGGTFRVTRQAVPLLRTSGGGLIVNIASTAGIFPYPYRSPYVASKWAMVGLGQSWAMELGEDNIRVNVICPGSVGGPRMDQVIEREAEATGVDESVLRSGYESQVSMSRFMDPADIAGAVVYMASPAGRHVSGQVLSVDGATETLRSY